MAFDVPDFSATVAALRKSGLDVIAHGRVGPGSEFAYFDCETVGTSVIEIFGFDDGTRAFMDQLKQLRTTRRDVIGSEKLVMAFGRGMM